MSQSTLPKPPARNARRRASPKFAVVILGGCRCVRAGFFLKMHLNLILLLLIYPSTPSRTHSHLRTTDHQSPSRRRFHHARRLTPLPGTLCHPPLASRHSQPASTNRVASPPRALHPTPVPATLGHPHPVPSTYPGGPHMFYYCNNILSSYRCIHPKLNALALYLNCVLI